MIAIVNWIPEESLGFLAQCVRWYIETKEPVGPCPTNLQNVTVLLEHLTALLEYLNLLL